MKTYIKTKTKKGLIKMKTLHEFIQLLREGDIKGDPWATAMSAFFDCSAHLYEKGDCPRHWQFRVGRAGNHLEMDSQFYNEFLSASPELLTEIGNFLHRYTAILKAKGRDY